jgi:small subunit ribosomal protein S15
MIDTKKKQAIIKKFQTHAGDTGSSEVQIAILTAEIEELSEHLKTHAKDHSSRRGLLRKVSTRRTLMRYIKREDPIAHDNLLKKLKIKAARVIGKQGVADIEEELIEEPDLTEKDHEAVHQ